ncbi:MAG: hypothetical protein PVH35_09845 [Syntrophobacterales bacterium]
MEKTSKNNDPQDNKTRQTEEDLSSLLDSINTEIDGMAEVAAQEESTNKDTPLSAGDAYAELDPELFFEEENLQLDPETAEDSANPSNEIQPKEGGPKTEMDASVDDKDKDEKMVAEKEKLNTDTEGAETTGEENAPVSISSDKIREDVDRTVDEKITPITRKSNKNSSGNREPESEVEEKGEAARQKLEAVLSNSDLANLMNSRIEKIVIRTLEEQVPVIVERSILDAIKKILLAM